MSMYPDIAKIMKDQRSRERHRDNINSQTVHSTFHIPLNGWAGSALSFFETDPIQFDVAYRPTQGFDTGLNPAFACGFEIQESALPIGAKTEIAGLLGFAKVARWIQTDEGYFTGVVLHIGVVNMSAGVTKDSLPISYEGVCHAHFVGRAVMLPLDLEETDV